MASKQRLGVEQTVLMFLASGGTYTAQEITNAVYKSVGMAFIWESLLQFERDGLAYRAFDFVDWRTLYKWKITGCGLLAAAKHS